MTRDVQLTESARKDLARAPQHVVDKLLAWVMLVKMKGLHEVRKVPGYHDEPLVGRRKGQRSIRLSRSWRAVYTQHGDGAAEFVRVEEVHKHAY
jgi:proteic killer suppression protein